MNLEHSPLQGGLMLERWVQSFWFGKRFTTDEHIIGPENDKVVRFIRNRLRTLGVLKK